jgi:hypothetical protein
MEAVVVLNPELTPSERSRLSELEGIVSRNLKTFYSVGLALMEIRDNCLHRETHDTFDAYCRDRWDIGRNYANRKIAAAKVVDNLGATVSILPANEYQVRPLTRLSPEKQREVWQEAVETAPNAKITARLVERVARRYINDGIGPKFSSLIKPSDSWNFSSVEYRRVDGTGGHGYLPGEIYVNCFWYYARPSALVVDPMAAAGMAKVVYDDRTNWMGEHVFDFDLRLFDLTPQDPCVAQHDLLTGFPMDEVDYIIIDPPYYGMARGQYSDKPNDLANMSLDEWTAAMSAIAKHCAVVQQLGALCTVISPNFRDIKACQIVMVTDIIRQAWESAGYALYDKAYAPRRSQQKQGTRMAAVNNKAKANRILLTEIAEVMTFQRFNR